MYSCFEDVQLRQSLLLVDFYMLTFLRNFWIPACTYFTTLLRLLWIVIGPFSWSRSMKKSTKGIRLAFRCQMWVVEGEEVDWVDELVGECGSTLIAYRCDCLWPRACPLAPINHDSLSGSWRTLLVVDTFDEPAWTEKRKKWVSVVHRCATFCRHSPVSASCNKADWLYFVGQNYNRSSVGGRKETLFSILRQTFWKIIRKGSMELFNRKMFSRKLFNQNFRWCWRVNKYFRNPHLRPHGGGR